MKSLLTVIPDISGSISKEDMEKFRLEFEKFIRGDRHSFSDLNRFPWIKDLDHLQRINKYRKRVKQPPLRFNDMDMTELTLMDRSQWRG